MPHEADAIFTELEDELISLKNNLLVHTSHARQNTTHVPIDAILNQSLSSFRHLCCQFSQVSQHFIEGSHRKLDCEERMRMRVCEAVLEESN